MNTSMNALLEAQADFERIELMIGQKFGIPADARILCGLHVPTAEESKYARGESELKEKYMVMQDYIDTLCTGSYDSDTNEFRYRVTDAKFGEVMDALISQAQHAAELTSARIGFMRMQNLLIDHFHMSEDAVRELMSYTVDSLPYEYRKFESRLPIINKLITEGNRFTRLMTETYHIDEVEDGKGILVVPLLFSGRFIDMCTELRDPASCVFGVSDEQVEEYLAGAGSRAEQIAKYLEILRNAYKYIVEQKAERKSRAAEFVEHPGPHDFIERQDLRNLPDNVNWDIVPLTYYLRVWAIQYMTYDDFFGIGNSSNAATTISKGQMATFDDAAMDIGRRIWEHLENPMTLPEAYRDYIALQEKRFLPGIIRIALDELGLMDYMADNTGIIDDIFNRLGLDIGTPSDTIRLKHFGKVVLPKFTIMTILGQPTPTAIYSKSELEKGDRYFGEELSRVMKDTVDNLDFVPDANLSRGKGGEPLSYDDMLDVVDVIDANVDDYVREATLDSKGEPFKADIGDKEDTGSVVSSTQLTVHTADPWECPAYKTGEWYVVYVQCKPENRRNAADYKSASGWFYFPEPGNTNEGKRFYFNSEYSNGNTSKFGVTKWCIVYSPDTYWSNYVDIDNNGYAYFFIHESAYDTPRADTAYGCTFDAIDAERGYNGVQTFAGMMRNRSQFMDRLDRYAVEMDYLGPGENSERTMGHPKNLIPNPDTPFKKSVNLSILLFSMLGKWDENITGEENIYRKVKELTDQWIPVCGGTMVAATHGMPSVHTTDITSIAKILTGMFNGRGKQAFLDILRGQSTIKYAGKEWVRKKIGDLLVNDVDERELAAGGTGYLTFIPYDMTSEEGTPLDENTPVLGFLINRDRGLVPVSNRPTTVGQLADVVSRFESKSAGRNVINSFRPEDTDIKWQRSPHGAASRRRVGFAEDKSVYICGPETDNEPLKVGDSSILPTRPRMYTYIATADGYNIVVTAEGYRDYLGNIVFVGYGRKGKVRWLGVDAIGPHGNAVMHEVPSTGNGHIYCIGTIDGNIKPMNNNRAGSYIYLAPGDEGYVDNIGLKGDVIDKYIASGHDGQFGLGTMNGQFGQNGNDSNVGIIRWYDEETLECVQGDTVVTVADINPSVMNSLPVIR